MLHVSRVYRKPFWRYVRARAHGCVVKHDPRTPVVVPVHIGLEAVPNPHREASVRRHNHKFLAIDEQVVKVIRWKHISLIGNEMLKHWPMLLTTTVSVPNPNVGVDGSGGQVIVSRICVQQRFLVGRLQHHD